MTTSVIRFINIVLAAILAGVSFGIWIGFNPMGLNASTYIEQQQNMLHSLRILMVLLVFLATIITIVSAYIQISNRATVIALLTAAILFIICILITRFGNKPIDDTILSWTSYSIPDNWTELRNKWWILHKYRTIAELGALFIITWTHMKKN